ncbi:hypothetical protein KDH_01630 [Dictyobacter sp. S3.2.2.5]|uniref:Uncharacterized protein n=1 Tax=Dictyobacter halimunensis TaxID=3026934 RepID=A0ABQ6FH36_9CHLR|nr:hypothetical protein KDH_01630 [Dictyobacter sp. S3.2.2.5]
MSEQTMAQWIINAFTLLPDDSKEAASKAKNSYGSVVIGVPLRRGR